MHRHMEVVTSSQPPKHPVQCGEEMEPVLAAVVNKSTVAPLSFLVLWCAWWVPFTFGVSCAVMLRFGKRSYDAMVEESPPSPCSPKKIAFLDRSKKVARTCETQESVSREAVPSRSELFEQSLPDRSELERMCLFLQRQVFTFLNHISQDRLCT